MDSAGSGYNLLAGACDHGIINLWGVTHNTKNTFVLLKDFTQCYVYWTVQCEKRIQGQF
jgi:hypothetical protein